MSTVTTLGLIADTHIPYRMARLPDCVLTALAGVGAGILILLSFTSGLFWCKRLCPLGATQDLLGSSAALFKSEPKRSVPLRRAFLLAAAGVGMGLVTRRLGAARAENAPLRPPGAVSEELFAGACLRCGNCVRACPYDNVALTVRAPGRELSRQPWARRGRLAVLALGVLLTYWGVMNALAMITPFYQAAAWLSDLLGTRDEAVLLGAFYLAVTLVGVATTLGASWLADRAGGARSSAMAAFRRWGYVVVALGFSFWAAHYVFHFLTGALSIVPVFQHFFEYRGLPADPNWRLAQMVPTRWLFPIQAVIAAIYSSVALFVAARIARRDFGRRRWVLALWPMLLYVLLFTALQLVILAQPMEMRGTVLGPLP